MSHENDKPLIGLPALAILQQAELVKKIRALGDTALLSHDVIHVSTNEYGGSEYDFSHPLVIMRFMNAYAKLENRLHRLDHTHPQIARQAATLLATKLTAFCHCYQEPAETNRQDGNNPFSSVDEPPITSVLQPLPLLNELETEFEALLKPVVEIHPVAQTLLVAGCMLIGAAIALALSMLLMMALSTCIPGIAPVIEHVTSPIIHSFNPMLGTSFPLLTVPNTVSGGVGVLLGGGLGFFAVKKIHDARFSVFRDCLKATKALNEKLDANKSEANV
jgi:hypothetical protein